MPSPRPAITYLLAQARRAPRLTAEEERRLILRFQRGDRAAGDRVVRSLLAFVVKVAREFVRYDRADPTEFVAAANLGLLVAMHRWDPKRHVRLITYAVDYMRLECRRLVLETQSIVRGGPAYRSRVFWKIQREERRARAICGHDWEAVHNEIGRRMRIKPAKVEAMLGRIRLGDVSLDLPVTGDEGYETRESRGDRLPAHDGVPVDNLLGAEREAQARHQARRALALLDPRERRIILARCTEDKPVTLEVLGREFGITRERVRQLEKRAKRKMRGMRGALP